MRKMKDSGIEWLEKVPIDWNIERLQWHLYEINVKNNPIKTTNILSLTNKRGVIPYEEKGAQGNISKENYNEYKIAYKDTIVANSMNILIGSVGYSNYEGCVSPLYYDFKEHVGSNLKFINYIMQTVQFQKELRKYANGILEIRLRVSADDILKTKVAIPSLLEQQKIVLFLDEKCKDINDAIVEVENQVNLLEEYKKSIITEKITFGIKKNIKTKHTNYMYWECIPEDWSLIDIKYLFEIVKRIAGKEGYDVLSVTQNGLKVKDLSNNEGQIAESYANYQFVYPTDFVMNHMDLLTGWVDCSTMFGVTSPDYRVFKLRDKNNNLTYYKYVLQSCYFNKVFYSLGNGVSNLGRWRLQTDSFNNFLFPVPSYEEQKQIAEYLDKKCNEIDAIIEEKKKQIEMLEQYKKSIIYEYVTGKKEVPNE